MNQVMEPSSAPNQSGPPFLQARGLRVTYGLTRALDGVEVTIVRGDSIAIIGPSGSGKSTLLHCLSGLVTPDEGQVCLNGRDLSTLPDAERSALRRQRFGFVFQFGHLVPELTALENVSLNLRLNGTGRKPAEETARRWLQDLDVVDLAGRRPGEMSGGQQQRVAVARALATDPDVIFADEPTGALDSANGELVMELLTRQVRDRHCALVLVTHDDKIAAYAEHELVLRDGRMAAPTTGVPR